MGVLTLSTHRALELPVGLAVALVPLIAGAAAFGTVVCVVLGALIVTLALSTNREGQALAGAAHVSSDRALAALLAAAAVVLAVLGQGLPAALCAGGAIVESLLTLFTSYVERPGRDDETRATTITAGG
jgi:hypothetical protein